eukprot:CAMPEP_0176191884 /NCGR_PEP_ID=MMETSP0121_2-20121125/4686_1 /TAXON_ID=160619 /ORGANISM="Kryptoperidinium foliaceum, Strain CCMP 1326" /LENGTH=88 /DNA_ID=CAMNT_0017530555 /DNA_START=249 /DNA_END=515 /DNA_ORIENTATION=+
MAHDARHTNANVGALGCTGEVESSWSFSAVAEHQVGKTGRTISQEPVQPSETTPLAHYHARHSERTANDTESSRSQATAKPTWSLTRG